MQPAVAALLAVAATTITACAGPTSDLSDYRHKAANSAEAMASQVQTALLTGQLVLDRRVPLDYAATTASNVDDDASSVEQTFDSRQPPDSAAADDLRDRLDAAMTDATSSISDMRIAIRRGSDADIRAAAQSLKNALPPLQELQDIA
jgi:predicted small secreted protein